MGYQKVVQYGDIVEYYSYEKNLPNNRVKHISSHTKKRAKARRELSKATNTYKRSKRSIKRSREAFFRLCHHNNCLASTIDFLTLTFSYDVTLKAANTHVRRFMAKFKENLPEVPFAWISVPEKTKKGRYHFHLLVYNLPPEVSLTERKTRNIQRLFQRGYVDISSATYKSVGLAGYLAKYMGKSLADSGNEAGRGYSTSRNIAKITSAGSDSFTQYVDMIVPTENVVQTRVYDVPFMGACTHQIIKK